MADNAPINYHCQSPWGERARQRERWWVRWDEAEAQQCNSLTVISPPHVCYHVRVPYLLACSVSQCWAVNNFKKVPASHRLVQLLAGIGNYSLSLPVFLAVPPGTMKKAQWVKEELLNSCFQGKEMGNSGENQLKVFAWKQWSKALLYSVPLLDNERSLRDWAGK